MKSNNFILWIFIALTLTITGCTSYDSVRLDKQQLNDSYTFYKIDPPLYEGDVVRYRLKNSTIRTATVKKTTPQGIISTTEQMIPFKEIVTLERKYLSKGKTVAAVGTGVGGAAIVIGTVLLIGFGVGFAAVLSGS